MEKRKQNEKGITLVALVVTIIVLVILVGVSVSVAINTGLIGNTKTAVEKYAKAQALEAAQLAYMSSQMINLGEEESKIVSDAIEDLKKQGYSIYTDNLDTTTIKNIKYMLNDGEIQETTITKGNDLEICLSTETEQSNNVNYYIQINNKYYLLTMNSEEVSIGDTQVDINNLENNDGESITEVTSNNTSIVTATLNDEKTNIRITGVSAGETTITTKTNLGKTASLKVIVTDLVLAESISLNYTEKELNQGETLQLVATILPSNTTDKTITWSSSNNSIATVDSNGLVTASSANTGTVIIFAETSNGKKVTVNINVIEAGLFSFTINGNGHWPSGTYYAREGMTWDEWVLDPALNTDDYCITTNEKGTKIMIGKSEKETFYYAVCTDPVGAGGFVKPSWEIERGGTYQIMFWD